MFQVVIVSGLTLTEEEDSALAVRLTSTLRLQVRQSRVPIIQNNKIKLLS